MRNLSSPAPLTLPTLDGWTIRLVGEWQARLTSPDGIEFTLARPGRSVLADVYPASHTDIVAELHPPTELSEPVVAQAVRDLIAATWAADPQARKLVVPVPAHETQLGRAVQDGGMRYVLMAESRDGTEFALHVAEPEHVAALTGDLDTLPE